MTPVKTVLKRLLKASSDKTAITAFFAVFLPALFIVFCLAVDGNVRQAQAQSEWDSINTQIDQHNIMVNDKLVSKNTMKDWLIGMKNWVEEKAINEQTWIKNTGFAAAWKTALNNFLNKLAYDTATYLATGDKGQSPMFETDSFGDYLTNSIDAAAGDMIETLGKYGPVKFNLCRPSSLAVEVNIGLGLVESERPKEPDCTFSKMINNWEQELEDPNFLNNFQKSFDPWENDMGIALSLFSLKSEYKGAGAQIADKLFPSRGEFKPVTTDISGQTKAPGATTQKVHDQAITDSTAAQRTYTEPGADSLSIFFNTLIGKLIDKWLKEGFVSNFPDNSYNWSSLSDYFSGGSTGSGIRSAKEQFASLIEPTFNERGDYSILSELTICPNPAKAGPTNCVITDNFRQAISDKMTVGAAMRKGHLNPNGTFGFTADGLEPSYIEGYPYRSMIILRKFRILPVGWELAAQYLKDHPGADGTNGSKNLSDLVACYDRYDDYPGYYADWCEGLVDPNWVLKAPANYCRREGPGPEIVSRQTVGTGADSSISLSRNDNYCADEQTCIKENVNGSCELYGYCTEERREWDFGTGACEPRYNTCQTFRAAGGRTVSYLENTLNYETCTAENAGCSAYCRDYDYVAKSYTCSFDDGEKIYLDKDAAVCKADEEGCHEFIRTKEDAGANLLVNPSFEDLDNLWPELGSSTNITSNEKYDGDNSFALSGALVKTVVVGPAEHSVAGENYILSFYSYDCGSDSNFQIDGQVSATTMGAASGWQYQTTGYMFPIDAAGNEVTFTITGTADCLIDAVKLERAQTATAYTDYGAAGKVYQKLAPDYLACDGLSDPKECDNYVRLCSADENGCDLFTSLSDGMSVPARVAPNDHCPAECVGYDAYLQSSTFFENQAEAYMVPQNARTCSKQDSGCDEFTNLDKLGSGAEAREYYRELKLCRKPDDTCASFYTWEGSDQTGYKLRVHSLETDGSGSPRVVTDGQFEGRDCSETDYDILNNPMCREFYNTAGEVSYRFLPYIVTCSEDCHPYRRSIVNGDCAADPSVPECCPNGGAWNAEHGACIYMAIPGEGGQCKAAAAGCREYSGNAGANMRTIIESTFEDGTNMDWDGENATESLLAGEHSLKAESGATSRLAGFMVTLDRSYVLKFKAKTAGGSDFTSAGFGQDAPDIGFEVGLAHMDQEWRLYEFNLPRLNNADGNYVLLPNAKLFIEADGAFYIDDIQLIEVIERYYLIKDTAVTPEACYYDTFGNEVSVTHNLGCDAYRDGEGETQFLKGFNKLCQDSAIGCQLMIDTQNSADPGEVTHDFSLDEQITVPADSFVYAVYDKSKACNAAAKGCERLGNPYVYGQEAVYSDIYLKNNPDTYGTTLCESAAAGCESFGKSGGFAFFKDPGDQACEWRQQTATTSAWNWYKQPVKRCDTDGNGLVGAGDPVCQTDAHCGTAKCVLDNNYYPCTPDYSSGAPKTLGTGGTGGRVATPGTDADGVWAGLCPTTQSGCTEYIDPISKFSQNIIFNSDFSQDVDTNDKPDGWNNGRQTIALEPNTLYVMTVEADAGSASGNTLTLTVSKSVLHPMDGNSSLLTATTGISVSAAPGERVSRRFYTRNEEFDGAAVSVQDDAAMSQVTLANAVVGYQLKQKTDSASCNGLVNFSEGCVLMNERKVQGGSGTAVSYGQLPYDADLTTKLANVAPQTAAADDERDANILLKVLPDRACDKWLACRSYIRDENGKNVCFDIGLCDRVDENGDCTNFVYKDKINETYKSSLSSAAIGDLSGYSKVGYNGNSFLADYYPLGAMDEKGEVTAVPNGDFEFYDTNKYPSGWNSFNDDAAWDAGMFSVVGNPYDAQEQGVEYPKNGSAFLRWSPSRTFMWSDFIDVEPGMEYVLSLYMNTIDLHPSTGTGSVSISARILTYDSMGRPVAAGNDIDECAGIPDGSLGCFVSMDNGRGWTMLSRKFKLGSDATAGSVKTTRVRISLEGGTGAANNDGFVYVDKVELRPALETRIDGNTAQLANQTCRLFPDNDSLSCSYRNDTGMTEKGWLGYCLEYDRYPGSPDACLLWYPVDRVKGDRLEEGAGYSDRYPLYYCLEAAVDCNNGYPKVYCDKMVQVVNPSGSNKYWSSRVYEGSKYVLPFAEAGDSRNVVYSTASLDGVVEPITLDYKRAATPYGAIKPPYPVGQPAYWDSTSGNSGNDPLYFKTDLLNTVYFGVNQTCQRYVGTLSSVCAASGVDSCTSGGEKCFTSIEPGVMPGTCGETGTMIDVYLDEDYYAPTLSCYGGSNIHWNCCNNNDDIVNEAIFCDWKGPINDVINFTFPIYKNVKTEFNVAASLNEAISGVKSLFAQSYGAWEWNEVSYSYAKSASTSLIWTPPANPCPGNVRPSDPASEFCGVRPVINKITVNGLADVARVNLNKNGYVNLAFTGIVDANQLPLTMYAINWGDGEFTTVSGVQMRDRPNPENPISLYHLYSYWDIKAKASQAESGVEEVQCGENCTADGYCPDAGSTLAYSGPYCRVRPSVKIRDNWGWCNDGASINLCDQWENFGGDKDAWVVVTDR